MPQTKMFRDRVVSMEQTLERGEKHLDFLKSLCRDAFPDFAYREHTLDHERDLFIMSLEAPDGRRKRVGWTRMVLFDAERLPALITEPGSPLRAKLIGYLRALAPLPEIVVTFRHLEEGWVEAPEPRREKRRGRRRGRPEPRAGRMPEVRGGKPPVKASVSRPTSAPQRVEQKPASGEAAPPGIEQSRAGGRRRRFRRRRRRGGAGPAPAPPSEGPS